MKKILLLFFFISSSIRAEIISIPAPNKGFFYSIEDTNTNYFENKDSQAILVYLPGGTGSFAIGNPQIPTRPLGMFEEIALGKNSKVKIDFVFMDSPYILSPKNTSNNLGIRATKDHLDRIKSTIIFYSNKTKKPIWLIGHSNGAYSLSSFLNADPDNQKLIAGAIFSSARNERYLDGQLNLPIMILHHKEDPCPNTLYSSAKRFYEQVKKINMAKTDFVTITGGTNSGEPCFSIESHHMFAGSYEQFTVEVENFIMQ